MEKTLFYIACILIFTRIGGMISRRFKMPEVLGMLLAGVVLGPAVLGLVPYDADIRLLSNLGVVLLMFLAGLETDLEEFRKAGKSSLVIATAGIVLPLILGTASAWFFFQNFWENIFIGVILTATSVSITVETLKEMGKLNTRSGINIMGAAVIDDILGLILISVVLASSQASSAGGMASGLFSVGLVFVKIAAFCLTAFLGIVFLPKFLNRFLQDRKVDLRFFTLTVALAFLVAAMAEMLGIAAITGAYLCGLMFSQVLHKDYLERNIRAVSTGFLSPVFFASVGLEADFQGVTAELLLITAVLFLAAAAGKFFGCAAAARLMHLEKEEAVQIGAGMISRGEVAIITANIGLQNGIISKEIFLPTLMVVILTTIVTPVFLKLSFRKSRKA